MSETSLLLHTCCAPCSCYVYELLYNSYNIVPFYYNPNISPQSEYLRRCKELEVFFSIKGLILQKGVYDINNWITDIKQYRFEGERSERCWKCYRIRLEGSFEFARKNNIEMVTSTLSISPHKDAIMINKIGKELEQKYQVEFLVANFKKRDGYRKSVELSKVYGFYRQDYCGCVYSKKEKYRNPRRNKIHK